MELAPRKDLQLQRASAKELAPRKELQLPKKLLELALELALRTSFKEQWS